MMGGTWRSAALAGGLFLCMSACAGRYARIPEIVPPGGIAVYGDSQRDHRVHRRVVEAILQTRPVAVFHAGDLVDDGSDGSLWDIFDDITKTLRESSAFYPALGNHDGHAPRFFSLFDLPNNERWYSVEIFDIHVAVLDSEERLDPASEQYRWLEEDLARSGSPFKIVVLHRPLFTSSDHGGDPALRADLVPLFEQRGVRLVFSGHHHNYEHSVSGEVHYVVSGGGGGHPDRRQGFNDSSRTFLKKHHFCLVRPVPGGLEVTAYDPGLAVLDSFLVPGDHSEEQLPACFTFRGWSRAMPSVKPVQAR